MSQKRAGRYAINVLVEFEMSIFPLFTESASRVIKNTEGQSHFIYRGFTLRMYIWHNLDCRLIELTIDTPLIKDNQRWIIRHKMGIDNPNEKQFYQIFINCCQSRGITFDKDAFMHLLNEYYFKAGRSLKACHPRDLLDQLADFATYRGEPPKMTIDLVDRAARSYFAELF